MGFRTRIVFLLASSVLVLAAGLSVVPALTPDPAVHVIPDGIAHRENCDSSQPDVSAKMQTWLDSLPNNSVAELGVNQCYRLELPVTIGAKTNLLFDGRGSTFASFTDGCAGTQIDRKRFTNCKFPSPDWRTAKDWPRHRYHLRIAGNKNITVKNLRIEGGKTRPGYDEAYEFQHGIRLTGGDDGVLLDNIAVDHVWGDFVNITAHRTSTKIITPQNITIQNSHFGLDRPYMGSGRQGFAINEGVNIQVHNNTIQYSSRSAVDIKPVSNGSILREIAFDDNHFGTHGNNFFANHPYGDHDPIISGIYFRRNELTGSPLRVDSVVANVERIDAKDPSTFRRFNYQFIDNHSDAKNATGGCPDGMWSMRFWGIDGLIIRGNTQPFPADRCMHLVEAAKVRDSRVTGNTALNAESITRRYYKSANYCESDNYTGQTLARESSTMAPPCTHIPAGPSGIPANPSGWTQTFADDFSGTSLSSCWGKYSNIAGSSDTLWDPSHITVHDGVADIDTYNDASDGRWASGGMSSAPCLKQKSGRYEMRFRMDKATGVKYAILLWPSFEPWPCGGEIDFGEDSGGQRDHTTLTVHYCDAQGNDAILPQQHVSADFSQYQTIGVEWTAGHINWLLNGTTVGTVSSTHVPASVMEFDVQDETVGIDSSTPPHVHMYIDYAVAYEHA